jgi:hypothetical protein
MRRGVGVFAPDSMLTWAELDRGGILHFDETSIIVEGKKGRRKKQRKQHLLHHLITLACVRT